MGRVPERCFYYLEARASSPHTSMEVWRKRYTTLAEAR